MRVPGGKGVGGKGIATYSKKAGMITGVCVCVSVGKCGTRNTAHGCGGYARKDPQNAHIGVHLCVHRELVQLPSTVHRAPIHWSEGDQSSYTNSLNAD